MRGGTETREGLRVEHSNGRQYEKLTKLLKMVMRKEPELRRAENGHAVLFLRMMNTNQREINNIRHENLLLQATGPDIAVLQSGGSDLEPLSTSSVVKYYTRDVYDDPAPDASLLRIPQIALRCYCYTAVLS